MDKSEFDYDLIVIGGGSGGMACAKQAADLGAKVALFDFVKPSSQGTVWGVGGTCVNVGCVPKKLMHYTGLLGHSFHDAKSLGWDIQKPQTVDWNKMVQTVRDHIGLLNFRYRTGLRTKNVNYINALAEFQDDPHKVYYTEKKTNEKKYLSTKYVVIATGGRPIIPDDIPGAREFAITSDDIFYLKHSPGKTLCVGASYISLECAGFLTELGFDVTVAARSILLRGFDRQCADKIEELMTDVGTRILKSIVVKSITKQATDGKLSVVLQNKEDGSESHEVFDTILFATGRSPDIKGLNLSSVGVEINSKNGKIPVVDETTNVPNIFAVGDVCEGKQELTPVAIRAGELLAKRLFAGSEKKMNYELVPTTVFTPFEYGHVGLSEEKAIERYGKDDIEVYLSEFTTLEFSSVHRMKHPRNGDDVDMDHNCLSKLVCVKSQEEKVVGFHYVGPNAGEITQGFALAVRLGAKKSDFNDLVGIHPTDAESFCTLNISRSSGIPWVAEGGCGGGVCG